MAIVTVKKAIKVTCYECVFVAVGIQHGGAHALYCHLWPARLYSIFPYLINNTTFENKSLNTKCVF